MNNQEKIEEMIKYCESKLGCPYVWGSNGPDTFDCSGLVLAALKFVDWYPKESDDTASGIGRYLRGRKWIDKLDRGSILLFGFAKIKITHIGLALGNGKMIHASGGGKGCTSIEIAKQKNACVKITDIRKDLLYSLYPGD